jgi:hypothetical protein
MYFYLFGLRTVSASDSKFYVSGETSASTLTAAMDALTAVFGLITSGFF